MRHFAIVTYTVAPAALRAHVHPRFELDCIVDAGGEQRALVSVVPFEDESFRFVRAPWFRWAFGQTNYRAYVRDTVTGERVVWFFGTSLGSISVAIPRFAWRLPWHRAAIRFECEYDIAEARYLAYRMTTRSRWAPASLELRDTGRAPSELPGFLDLETALVTLTHPLVGYYHRRDGRLGTYGVSHPRLQPTVGRVMHAQFPLLDRLGLVPLGATDTVHSVLMQSQIDFGIALPPTLV